MSKKPTKEQQAVIDCQDREILVSACAGSGKTSTLQIFAESRPRSKMLYLAFNKAIKQEAESRFPSNVRCMTTHGLAYAKFGKFFSKKIGFPKPYHLQSALEINMTQAGIILNGVLRYFASADKEFSGKHFAEDLPNKKDHADAIKLGKKAWEMMQDMRSDLPMHHDGYLKLYQLSEPQLEYDYVLFDEYQDANPVTQAIVAIQKCKRIYVGDSRQSIYAFRGAVNTMDTSEVKTRLALTHSFRFGDGSAMLANAVLGAYQIHKDKIVGSGQFPTVFDVDRSYPHTVLCRTNGMLFTEAVTALKSKVPFGFVGGVENYKFDTILDAYHLKAKKRGSIRDKFIASFEDFESMIAYADALDDREIKFLGRVVKDYGHDIPDLIKKIQETAVKSFTGNEIIMTTAHRSKGLEWMDVVLTEDFTDMNETQKEGQGVPPDIQEINLLYVAATRAMRGLCLPNELVQWIGQHDPALYQLISKRNKAANTDLVRLGDYKLTIEEPAQKKSKKDAEDPCTEALANRDMVISMIRGATGKTVKEMIALADQLAEESSGCLKGNPARARQLSIASGVIAALIEGDLVLG